MDSKDKRMCGLSDDVNQDYEEDCLGDLLNMLDLPVDNLEGDGLAEDWASKLGPIPSEVFRDLLPPVPQFTAANDNDNDNGNGGSGGGNSMDSLMECGLNADTCEPKRHLIRNKEAFKSRLQRQDPKFSKEKKQYPMPRTFEAPSPDSVLERGGSSSSGKAATFGTKTPIPVGLRSKRTQERSADNPWLRSKVIVPPQTGKKKRENLSQQPVNETKKCSHCETTETPQWREGPMGPKTLCNACGVRYRSGRLFPEYRPAASPTFIPSLHSNSHRKVIEMRQKGNDTYIMKKHSSSDVKDLES